MPWYLAYNTTNADLAVDSAGRTVPAFEFTYADTADAVAASHLTAKRLVNVPITFDPNGSPVGLDVEAYEAAGVVVVRNGGSWTPPPDPPAQPYTLAQLDTLVRTGRLSEPGLKASIDGAVMPVQTALTELETTTLPEVYVPAARPADAVAVSGLGRWDPARFIYNETPANLRKFRGYLAKAIAGTDECRIAAVGDSIVAAQSVSPRSSLAWPNQVRRLLARRSADACGTGPVLCHFGDSQIDSRWAFTGDATWSKFNVSGNTRLCLYQASGGTSAVGTFTSDLPGTVAEVWYSNASGPFTVAIDGGSAVTVTPSGGTTIGKYQVTGLADTTHTITCTRTSGVLYLSAACVRKTTGVSVASFGLGGAKASSLSIGQPYDLSTVTRNWAPHLITIGLMTNEANEGVAAATYKTNMQGRIDVWHGIDGIDMLLIANIPGSGLDLTPYRQALYELADENNLPLLDLTERWGSYATANGLGQMFDAYHPSGSGYGDYASAVVSALVP